MSRVESPDEHQSAHGDEIESLAEFDAAVAAGSLAGRRVQSVDLTERSAELLAGGWRPASLW